MTNHELHMLCACHPIVKLIIFSSLFMIMGCTSHFDPVNLNELDSVKSSAALPSITSVEKSMIIVPRDISIENYHSFIDSLVNLYKKPPLTLLDEYTLIHNNLWILDSLRATDYYLQKKKNKIVYDQSKAIVLHKGDSVVIPNHDAIDAAVAKLNSTIIDVNIPEFRLRILQEGDTILNCKVRVGRNDTAFLPLVGHVVDMKTPIGQGEIIRVEKTPTYVNPDTGEKFDMTRRDDGRVTKMPIIPWIEPTINGVRYGTMIHPTTNPRSLGRAISHGCIGTTEADAWTIFYNAPIGTTVVFRYDLQVINSDGATVKLRDIYQLRSSTGIDWVSH